MATLVYGLNQSLDGYVDHMKLGPPAPAAFSHFIGLVRGTVYSIGLGTHAENAKHLVYADDVPYSTPQDLRKMAIPVGVTCRFCERTDCNQRAAASYRFAFSFDEYTKKDCFSFSCWSSGEKKIAN